MRPHATPTRLFDAANPRRRQRALEDLASGLARWRLAWALARSDITHRYRGSILGPFWVTLSTAVMLGALGILYAKLFRVEVTDYLPWLAVSLILWNLLSQLVTDATTSLTNAEAVIRQIPLPYSVHALRVVMRNALIAAHNLPLIGIVFVIFGVPVGWTLLLAIPGFLLIAAGGFAAALFLGMVCARFRDIPPIVASVMQLAFFVSAVIWKPELVGHWEPFLPLNPFFAVLEAVRAPIMGGTGGIAVWLAALSWVGLTMALAWAFFVRFRGRIASGSDAMALIEATGLAIEFPLYHHNARSLKQRILASSRLRLKTDRDNRIVVAALRDLTFSIRDGERVALVGPNGAGKTTLLRTVAGVYEPVAGRLRVEGEIGSLIDLSAGMDPLLTGRENIVLRALYRGMTEAEGRALADEVAGFAGLGDFLDVPIRGYSAGMNVRLAFAMATAMSPEILLMDEWFLAGDAEFMARAEERLARLITGAQILLIATHDMAVVRKWCTRVIRLEGGRITADGPLAEVLGPAEEPAPAAIPAS